ncbi:MAG: ATP-binding cassette domain-containing protein [Polyangiales bacterium]
MQTLEAVGLTRRYGDRVAVKSLGFRVARGEVLGFLGPNGAGKTTTFSMLAGLLAADGGHLLLDGERIAPGARALRARMGIVFQHPSVDPKLSARENLAMGAQLYGLSGKEARERVEWGLELVSLTDRGADMVETYSGGMRRRLELARVLLHKPEILLLDEPTQGLDVAAGRRIWSQLMELRKREKLTILLTTHSPEEAEHCDRIVVLDKGAAIAEGTPDELRARVGGDVVTMEVNEPEAFIAELKQKLAIEAQLVDGKVIFKQVHAHEAIPRLVEAFGPGRLRSIGMRAASIGDVFLQLTGKTLDGADLEEAADKPPNPKKRR